MFAKKVLYVRITSNVKGVFVLIANNRKMNDLKNDILELLEKERYISDMLTGFVEGGFIVGEEKIKEFIKTANYPQLNEMIVQLSKEEIMGNAYLRDIKIPKTEIGNIEMGRKRFIPANTLTAYGEKIRNLDTFEPINSFFICDSPLRFPGVSEKGESISWMTVEPIEIQSFQKFIDEAKGNVCLCGCGLGYVAYMLSLKESVESITIVELNPNVIDIFESVILPQFKNREKVKVVQSDAVEYLEDNDLNQFDQINVDIWRDTLDMLPIYLQCLAIESAYPNVEFSYWLEPTLKDVLRKNILEHFSGYDTPRRQCESFMRRIALDILDNTDISSKKELQDLLKLDDMRDVLYHWYITHPQLFAEYQKVTDEENRNMLNFLNAFNRHRANKKDQEKKLNYPFEMPDFLNK